jgi:polyvinyl alcohol dehydrogenase (cytochrome)
VSLRKLALAAAAAAGVALAPVAWPARADWPSYGHDLANTRNAGPAAPSPRDARRLAPAWTFTSHSGGMTGTPVVAGGTVVIGSNRCVLYALDLRSGRIRWKRSLLALGCAYMPGSAAVDGGVVYVAFGSRSLVGPQVAALSLSSGSVLWHTPLDPSQGLADVYASPVVWNGGVYVGISGQVAEEGETQARLRGALVSLDARTGAVRWRTYVVPPELDGGAVWSTAAIDPALGTVYVGSGNAYHRPAAPTTDAILALTAASGGVAGAFSAVQGDVFLDFHPGNGPDADFGASPNLFAGPDGRPLVGELAKNGVYSAVDRRTMRPVWQRRTGTINVAGALSSTAYDGRRVYGQTDRGQVWALEGDGRQAWSTHRAGKTNFSPVAVGHGVVYSIEAKGFLDARRASDAAPLARLRLGATSWGGLSIEGRTVLATTGTDLATTGRLIAFRPRR